MLISFIGLHPLFSHMQNVGFLMMRLMSPRAECWKSKVTTNFAYTGLSVLKLKKLTDFTESNCHKM